jgi:cyclic-di-GMP phosphodiesterase, flagellum assembly factor TipF
MSFVRHLFVALMYATVAAAVAVSVPRLLPGIGIETGLMLGGVVLLCCALLHEVFARQIQQARQSGEIHDLRLGHGEVIRELTLAREEVGNIHDALSNFRGTKTSSQFQSDFENMVSEVRLLQNLVEQLTTQSHRRLTGELAQDDNGAPVRIDPNPPAAGSSRSVAPVANDLDDAAILQIIQDGLRQDRVDLVLQPIVSLPQRKRKYFEAFTRIRADDGSIILPEQYISIAEREGLITAIDNMLLFRCVQQLRKTQGPNKNVGFFCNISPYTLADLGFFSEFVEFMSEHAELASNLIFEFSQATIANQDEQIMRQLARLAAMGFRFSLDQVATLKLDFVALSDQHFKFVKIEAQALLAEFAAPTEIKDIDLQDLKRAFERHGIDLIVEKIETEPTLLEVLDFQVDFGQGYLFGAPSKSHTA